MLANQDMFLPDEVTILSPEKSELSPQLYWIYLESELLGVLFILGYFKNQKEKHQYSILMHIYGI